MSTGGPFSQSRLLTATLLVSASFFVAGCSDGATGEAGEAGAQSKEGEAAKKDDKTKEGAADKKQQTDKKPGSEKKQTEKK